MHFTSRGEWARGRAAGVYAPETMRRNGSVPLAFGHQLTRVASEHARGRRDLVLLVVDPAGLEADLRIESGFPHLYRPVPMSAVRLVADFPPEADGSFALPDAARLAELALVALPSLSAVLERCRMNMAGFARPWWIGGGWACDAPTGVVSRPHLDVDVVVLRPDVTEVGHFVNSWDVRLVGNGTLREWDGHEFSDDDHQLWLRPDDGHRPHRWQDFAADPQFFEILVESVASDGMWVFRRNGAVRDRVDRLGAPGGFLRPEVALLYKAAAAAGDDDVGRAKAQADFDHAVAFLERAQRQWLLDAVLRAHPGHPWLSQLTG